MILDNKKGDLFNMLKTTNSLIGIVGQAGSGKSTLADYLVSKYNYIEYAFAHPLKEGLIKLFGIDKKYLYEQEFKHIPIPDLGITGRELMQKFGTEIMKGSVPMMFPNMNLGKYNNIWIKLAKNKIDECRLYTNKSLIISDVRFLNESSFIIDNAGIIIKIIRPNINSEQLSNDEKWHSSEIEMNGIKTHVTIINDGTREDLYKKIDALFLS
jgi:GTPase SAR1 family protein